MPNKPVVAWLAVIIFALGFAVGRLAAATESLEPPGPPGATFSYTLEDIYVRLTTGAAGTPRAFTEPTTGPSVGTMHTLNDLMAQAPAVNNTNGATTAQVLVGKTVWGLTSGQWGVITGTAPYAAVPKTGQNGCYDASGTPIGCAGTGQDYEYQRGVDWPAPRFVDNGNGTVTDRLTGLLWLKNANCFGGRTWTQALNDANNLNTGECGLNDGSVPRDWRLPNVRELHSLWNFNLNSPALWGGIFTNLGSGGGYWTSTTYMANAAQWLAWQVNADSGDLVITDKNGSGPLVWPVRGGP